MKIKEILKESDRLSEIKSWKIRAQNVYNSCLSGSLNYPDAYNILLKIKRSLYELYDDEEFWNPQNFDNENDFERAGRVCIDLEHLLESYLSHIQDLNDGIKENLKENSLSNKRLKIVKKHKSRDYHDKN